MIATLRSLNVMVITMFFVVTIGMVATARTAHGDPGGITDNSGFIPFEQAYFAFEVEGPVGTLKEVPIWDELEQMLDNPYQFALDPSVGGNFQGWPSYRSTQPRRRSFIYRNGAGQPCAPAQQWLQRGAPGRPRHPPAEL